MEGTQVRLRAYQKRDLEIFLRDNGDFATRLSSQGGIPYPPLEQDTEQWLNGLTAKGEFYLFIIERLEDDAVIGYCTVQSINWHSSAASVGIEIFQPANQGKGYGTEAMNLLIDFIFLYINVNKVKLGVFGFNERAVRSYEKCGFQVEGRMREEMFRNGQRYDLILMGLLRCEWEAMRAEQATT